MLATDEDTLPFAFAGRSGWGGPKKVKRVATLGGERGGLGGGESIGAVNASTPLHDGVLNGAR
jgi:hypothetical protein